MQRVLVLGTGLVARPLVRHLLDRGYHVTVAGLVLSRAQTLVDNHPQGEAHELDFTDEVSADRFVAASDLVVSLLPFQLHPQVASLCLRHRKHMVTTSYVSPEMQQLGPAALDAGITVLNEVGVDPGLDHMSAMRIIEDVRARHGRIVSFRSYCGGLPAPEANDNPFGYKFSWAPRGVLLASRNSARYLLVGRPVEVPGERLFRDMRMLQVPGAGDFEAYPNRDSIAYIEIYGLQWIETMFRGTLRNIGWCDCLYHYRRLGLLDLDERDLSGTTYQQLIATLLGTDATADLAAACARKMGIPVESQPVRNLEWLGFFSDRLIEPPTTTALDALGALMLEKLSYRPGERDMIVLFHDFEATFPDGRRERITSTLVDHGIAGGDSSMARTVSLPAAIGADLILQGRISRRGVLRPVTPDIYEPILADLADLGIACREESETY